MEDLSTSFWMKYLQYFLIGGTFTMPHDISSFVIILFSHLEHYYLYLVCMYVCRYGSVFLWWYEIWVFLRCEGQGTSGQGEKMLCINNKRNLWEVLAFSGGCWGIWQGEMLFLVRWVLICLRSHSLIVHPPGEAVRLWWGRTDVCFISCTCDTVWLLKKGISRTCIIVNDPNPASSQKNVNIRKFKRGLSNICLVWNLDM